MKSPSQELVPGAFYDFRDLVAKYGSEVIEMMVRNGNFEESSHKLSCEMFRYVPTSDCW